MDEITYKDGVYYIGYQDPGLYEFYYNTKEKHLNSIDGLDSYFDDFLLEMMNEKLGEEEVERLREGDGEFDFLIEKMKPDKKFTHTYSINLISYLGCIKTVKR